MPSIYMHCTRSSSGCSSMQDMFAQLTWGSRSSNGFSSMQGIYACLTGGSRSSSGCRGMEGIYAQLIWGSIFLLYICILLDLPVGVAVYKASILD